MLPHIGALQLHELDRHVLHELYRKLLKRGGRRGLPLSPTTVRTVHRILMKALGDMGLDISGVRQPRKERRTVHGRKGIWTATEAAAFLQAVRDDRLYAAWALAVVCGMRRGELAGLRWSNIDLSEHRVAVEVLASADESSLIGTSPVAAAQDGNCQPVAAPARS